MKRFLLLRHSEHNLNACRVLLNAQGYAVGICEPCEIYFTIHPNVALRSRRAECPSCRVVGHLGRADRHQLARQLYDRDATLDHTDVLESRVRIRPVLNQAPGFAMVRVLDGSRAWACPRCTATDSRGRLLGRRPWAEYQCWRCGWSHYDAGPPFVAVLDEARLDAALRSG